MDLKDLRNEIDEIDSQLIPLLQRRMGVSKNIRLKTEYLF